MSASLDAQSADPGDRKIDGSNESAFEASVIALQNDLPPQRREELEVALAVVWITSAVDVSDLDHDGDFDLVDLRLLKDESDDLLTAIDRGNVLAAIEERANDSQLSKERH